MEYVINASDVIDISNRSRNKLIEIAVLYFKKCFKKEIMGCAENGSYRGCFEPHSDIYEYKGEYEKICKFFDNNYILLFEYLFDETMKSKFTDIRVELVKDEHVTIYFSWNLL